MKRAALCLTCLIALSAAELQCFGDPPTPAEQKRASLLDKLKPDQAVSLTEKDGRYEIGILPKEFHPLNQTVIEVGRDYVVLRDLAGITDMVIPIYSIKAIRIMKVPTK